MKSITAQIVPENLNQPLTISLAIASTLATCYYISQHVLPNQNVSKLREIPIAEGYVPYFGHLFSLKGSPVRQLAKWQKETGPIMKVYMGVKPWIIIGDPHLAHAIFCENSNFTSNRPFQHYTQKHYSQGRGIVFPDPTDEWNKTRATVLRLIAPKSVSALSHVLIPESDYVVDHLLDATAKNGQVEILEPLRLASTNIILAVGLGKRAESIDDPLFREILGIILEGTVHANLFKDKRTFLPAFSLFDYRHDLAMKRFIEERVYGLYSRLIKEAMADNADCLVNRLKKLDYMDEKAMIVTINDTVSAGSANVAVTISWAILILCVYQDIQKTLRDEVDSFIKLHDRLPTFDERDHLPHLVSAQKECLRYRTTSPVGVLHEASNDFTCQGYFIPKGATLVSNTHAMHFNPDIYSDPEKFIPDRFLDRLTPMSSLAYSGIQKRDHYGFGWGRRTCPGAYLAEVEMFTILVRLLAKSIFLPMTDESGKEIPVDLDKFNESGVALCPAHTTLRICRRTDALI